MSDESRDNLAANVLRLGQEVRYYAIEAKDFEAKWIRVMEENEKLRAEVEQLRKESADWQESYHIVNERMSALLKKGTQS